ncbi:SMP-30/gluconolactonase/LRE family protein [bacterium]|nr:SMP-30/gluconolactonase/LRE family protein [bacterium]
MVIGLFAFLHSALADDGSVYTQRPEDPEAYYFTPDNYGIRADGVMDVSDALQNAINQVKTEKNYGILFIPEGTYRISRTIYVPAAIRLIGYGENRPEIILGENTPGYQAENGTGDDPENYMIWFTGSIVTGDNRPRDAGAGTFYSAISNIDFRIEEGNPIAVALRTHYAQHGFVSHSVIHIGSAKAGISQVGNEMENVEFHGGDYGIVTGPTSPSWPMMIVDTYFEGQRRAAIRSHNSGLTIVHMHVENVPVVMEIEENAIDRLFLENCLFEDVTNAGIVINSQWNSRTQINMLNIDARNVPIFAKFRDSDQTVEGAENTYTVREFTHGLVMNDLAADSEFKTTSDIVPSQDVPSKLSRDIPSLPPMEEWVNIKDLGAVGDGETDDTEAFRNAIANHEVIYVPQGWYRLTETVKMERGTKLIGLHPWATQFILKECEPVFSGFGGPKPMLESSEGGGDIVNGIGISTGGFNYRAVGLKWMAGANSLLNDIKFVGGHGTMRPPSSGPRDASMFGRPQQQISSPSEPVYEQGMDEAWDNQFWSLWVTNNGGGTLKDIWTANTYATSGMLVSNTSTPGRIYAMSIEHHVRNEVRFDHASNWKMLAFQFEEEYIEGIESQMLEVTNCKDLLFGNLWMYRTIRVETPKRFGMRLWNSESIQIRNLHNYTQKLWVTEFPVWDVNKELAVYPWEFAKLTVTGKEQGNLVPDFQVGKVNRLASGFDFAQGLTADSQGNIYFCETRKKRIYQWSAETGDVTLIADFPFQPFALATDSEDNLLVVCRYDPQPGFMVNGEQETVKRLPDDNVAYSSWGNSGWAAYAYSIDPDDPDDTFEPMPRMATADIKDFNKTYYPSSRWHYTFDAATVYYPDSAFVAPDGVTFIQETYDIGRTADLSAAVPGETLYASDEIAKRTVKMDVGEKGRLSNLWEILPRGETSTAVDHDGNLYVADGQIFVYNRNLNELDRINLLERPISITFGGKDRNILFITTVYSLYGMRIK